MEFARSNGLRGRCCEITMRDEYGRSWTCKLGSGLRNVYLTSGIREFFKGNGLKEEDAFMLEVIENGEKPILNFYS